VTADRVYGAPLEGVDVVVAPTDLASLLAEAHWRIRGREPGIHLGDGVVVGRDGTPIEDRPPVDRWVLPDDEVVDALARAERPVVLAGPGVVLDGAVPGLHAFAAGGSLGVLNTWGAKGAFDWRSRHHLATAGLQARDFALGGLGEADLIVATGLDPREALADWRLAPVAEVHPWALGPLSERWGRAPQAIERPPLFTGLAAVTQAGWAATRAPLPPTKVTQHYGRRLGGGGLVAADPGLAGYWVARTVGTTGVGGVLVSADRDATGSGLAAAIVARLLDPGRAVLAVSEEVTDVHRALLDVAASLGVTVALEVWAPEGPSMAPEDHDARLDDLVRHGGVGEIGTDPAQLDEMLQVAGPVVAWTA
jgi:hypothetical protein